MTPKLTHYKCPVCNCNWEQKQGGSVGWDKEGRAIQPNPPPRGCPMCGSLYIKWENYEDFDITLKKRLDKG